MLQRDGSTQCVLVRAAKSIALDPGARLNLGSTLLGHNRSVSVQALLQPRVSGFNGMRISQEYPRAWVLVSDHPDCVSTSGPKELSELSDDEFIDCNSEANARMVAATPELIEALQRFLSWEEYGVPTLEECSAQARSALKRVSEPEDFLPED